MTSGLVVVASTFTKGVILGLWTWYRERKKKRAQR
jgi:hypothetical protein